jgi:hypothetical protein
LWERGWGRGGERANKYNQIECDECGNKLLRDLTLGVHPLPNPSPIKDEGLSRLLRGRLKVNGTAVIVLISPT